MTERKETEKERERFLARELSARAQAEERRRLSRDLHERDAHDITLVHQYLELYDALRDGDPEKAETRPELEGTNLVVSVPLGDA